MKRSAKILIGAGCTAAIAALGVAGWRTSHYYLDPVQVRKRKTTESETAYAERKGPVYKQGLAWFLTAHRREETTILSFDGFELSATVLPGDDPEHRWVILVHGHEGSRDNMASYAQHYAELGWNILMPDLRGHGASQGTAITMGAKEKTDLLGWVEYVRKRDPKAQIVLHGISMGASTCLMASGLAPEGYLKAVISDCAFSSFARQSFDIFRRKHWPALSLMLASSLAARVWAGFCPCQASAVAYLKNSVTPTLFVHGTEDAFVSPGMLASLCDACTAPKEWLLIPGAGHGNAMFQDPDHYWNRVEDFLDRSMHPAEEAPVCSE